MIVLYVVMGTAPMMLFGFIAVAGIVQGQLASIPVTPLQQLLVFLVGKKRISKKIYRGYKRGTFPYSLPRASENKKCKED